MYTSIVNFLLFLNNVILKFDLTNKEEQLKAVHYTNLQPLWALDNYIKNNKILNDQSKNNYATGIKRDSHLTHAVSYTTSLTYQGLHK